MGAHRDEDRVEAPLVTLGDEILDPMLAGDSHAQVQEPLQLAAEHVTRHPVGGNPVAHHPAWLSTSIADLDLVAQPGKMVSGRQPARPGAYDQHPLAAACSRLVKSPFPLQREVTEEPFDRVDRDRAVEVGAVADALARVVADAPVDRRERVVGDQLPPRLLVVARLGVGQPRLDVLPGRAARVARR
jgi:hypothetical protein